MKKCILILCSMMSLPVFATYTLTEGMTYHIRQEYPGNAFDYKISFPGADAYLADGKYHSPAAMPACVIVVGDHLSKSQLQSFTDQLKVIGSRGDELPLKNFKGTLNYVDVAPFGSSYTDSFYSIKTKDGSNFGDLLTNIGGTQDSNVAIWFDRGCRELAVRPYLPEVHDAVSRPNATQFIPPHIGNKNTLISMAKNTQP